MFVMALPKVKLDKALASVLTVFKSSYSRVIIQLYTRGTTDLKIWVNFRLKPREPIANF